MIFVIVDVCMNGRLEDAGTISIITSEVFPGITSGRLTLQQLAFFMFFSINSSTR